MAEAQATFEPDGGENEPSILFPGVDRDEYLQAKQTTEANRSSLISKPMLHTAEPYDPHRIPPVFDTAKRHAIAKKVANFQKKQTDDNEKESDYCPCCGNPFEAERFSLCCSVRELSELGEGFPLQFNLVRWVVFAFLAALLVAGVYCLHQNYAAKRISEWDDTLDSNMIMESSLANFGRTSSPSLLQPWLHVLCMWLFLVLHQYMVHKHKQMCTELDQLIITPSDYTCMFRGLPASLDTPDFVAFIEALIPNCKVSKVNFVYDVSEFVRVDMMYSQLKSMRKRMSLQPQIVRPVGRQTRCFLCLGSLRTLDDCDLRLLATEKQLRELQADQKNKFIGIAFVTFQQDEMAKEFALKFGRKKNRGLGYTFCSCFRKYVTVSLLSYHNQPLLVQRAPEPDDLLWENLSITKAQRRRKRLLTYFATTIVLLICAGVIYGSSVSKKAIRDRKRDNPNPSAADNFVYSLVAFLPSILVVFINMTLGIVVRKFSVLERHKTLTHYDSSVLKKLTVAMFLNTAVVAIAVHWGQWYEPGGLVQEVYNISIANAIVPPILTIVGPKFLIRKLRQCLELRKGDRSMLTQAEAQLLFEGVPLDMAQRCAAFMKTYMLTLFYAPILPLVYVIGAVALTLQYWADKFMLLRVNSRPDVLSHELDDTMLGFLSLGTVLYAATNMLFFYDAMDSAIAPGVVGIVTTVAYNFLPVKKWVKALRFRTPVSMEPHPGHVASESEKTYEEVMVDFTDDYDRCNPVTAEEGKRLWREALRKKHPSLAEEDDLFPGVEPDVKGGAFQLAKSALIKKTLGQVGPRRVKAAPALSTR